ncbi:hypothetical protein C1752_12061 [Acaryochloris thomasi RCC1774]|uniref:DRBM domain-containing protein n=1 Tax=Acaryochloris thomasi RCC1774 TaxID=1764569 RepID=A0A2W1J7X5_9CYAN|nr:hypothetical protein C1752_12061 [Acaryochloris thomasi RCC1774]
MLSIAVIQEDSWDALKCTELSQDSSFFAWAEVYIDGELQTTAEAGCDLRKQVARHRAYWLWLSAFVHGELVGVDARIVPEVPVVVAEVEPMVDLKEEKLRSLLEKPPVDGQNHVGRLVEICQLMDWELPTFEFEEVEEGYRCICFMEFLGEGIEGIAISGKKKLTKQRAAMFVLEEIQGKQSNSS